ncbi:alpha/beta hydrolase [Luteipulveratus sp. YIM 133132]|uniref:alpha/beta fold hydrolase n=1 Tax=Luteipulveratus flavus TaxID=3031728 RepID=UPI0023B11BF6|nr:alpha/beta hydrolase [Luteipulveratus sp. YIM 133132]MDE9367189.1 alpha/beta hydrolase [Luteipulveratus sp. YIM 133132]
MTSTRQSALRWGVGAAVAGAAGVAGLAVGQLVRNRRTERPPDDGCDYVETPDEERVVIADDGVPLHVEIDHARDDASSRTTVVLTHGYTLNLTGWVFQRRALREAGYRIVLWDHRGHGRSEEGEDSSYEVGQLGDDLAAVIRETTPEGEIVLIGHSMGGMAVMAFAEQHPEVMRERVIGVGLLSTSAGGLRNVDWGLGQHLGAVVHRLGPSAVSRLANQQDLVRQALRAGQEVEELAVHHFSFASHVPRSIIRLTADMIFATRLHVIGAFLPTLMEHHRFDGLTALDGVETLVMNGTEDRLTPPDHSEAIVAAVPGAEHVVVTSGGHVLMLEHPDLVNEQLLALLQRADRAVERPRRRPRVRRTVTDLTGRRRGTAGRSRGRAGV